MTHFSPQMVAMVETRTSMLMPSTSVVSWPSCGRRRSTMFMPAMILIRLTSPSPIDAGQHQDVLEGAVDPEADPDDILGGLDVDVRGPVPHGLGEDAIDDLDNRCRVVHDLAAVVSASRRRADSTSSNACTSRSTPPMAR